MDQHGQVAGVRGLETPLGMNPPLDPTSAAAARVREIVNRANERQNASWAGRDLEENWGPQMAFGGARPRPRNRAELAGRGGFLNRIENRQLTSPRRAYQMPEDPGRFLARRLERMERIERLEDERGNRDRQEVQELRRRHEEERANWQRQQDEMAQRMAQMQQQLDALRLAPPQQQQPNIPVQPVQPPQVPQAPQLMNQFNVPPPPLPNPVAVRPYPPPPQFPQPGIQQQIPPQPPLLHQNQLVQSPRNWQLQPPHGGPRVATPVGPRTPMRHDVSDDEDQWGRNRANNRGRIDRRNLKLRTFKGKDVDAWKSLFDDFAEEFQWSEVEKRLQLKAHVDDWIRTMFTNMPPDTTAAEMMARLVNRFGVTLTSTEVENKLMTIERKAGEGLYALSDRVKNLANRARIPWQRKQAIMRQSFFAALKGNHDMQHFINYYDPPENPNIDVTLDIAIEYERIHGTTVKIEKVRRVDTSPDDRSESARTGSDDERSEVESVNKISYIPLKEMTTEEGRRLAKQNNELVSLLKKQAYTVLDEDRRSSSSSSRGRYSQRGRGYSSSRSSESWSRPRRSRSRDKRERKEWRDKGSRNRSRDKYRRKSRERNSKKREDKYDKKKKKYGKDSRVAEVQDSPTTQSEHSDSNTQTNSDSEDTE